jgi:hypothetical protein
MQAIDDANFLQPADFQQLVARLLSQEAANEQRQQADAMFEQVMLLHPNGCAHNLIVLMRSSPQVERRAFAAIMLRKARIGVQPPRSFSSWQLRCAPSKAVSSMTALHSPTPQRGAYAR